MKKEKWPISLRDERSNGYLKGFRDCLMMLKKGIIKYRLLDNIEAKDGGCVYNAAIFDELMQNDAALLYPTGFTGYYGFEYDEKGKLVRCKATFDKEKWKREI